MQISLKLSRIGMNMQEATIVKWNKQVGDEFSKGDILYEIETEKVTQQVAAPVEGKIIEILVAEEENARVGEVLCVVEMNS
ncbi:MAG: biotin/lipoyl-containing protein [Gammaproteobacteria bacterium]